METKREGRLGRMEVGMVAALVVLAGLLAVRAFVLTGARPVLAATLPVVSNVQGFNPALGASNAVAYTTGVVQPNQYLVIYGTFDAANATVLINGSPMGSDFGVVTYASSSGSGNGQQINVFLTGLGSKYMPIFTVGVLSDGETSNVEPVSVGGSAPICAPGATMTCTSAANSCGQTNAGTKTCTNTGSWGACSAAVPSQSSCTATPPTGVSCIPSIGTFSCPFSFGSTTDSIDPSNGNHTDASWFIQDPTQDFYGTISPLNNLYLPTQSAANSMASCISKGLGQNVSVTGYPDYDWSTLTEYMLTFPGSGNQIPAGVLIANYEQSLGGVGNTSSTFCHGIVEGITPVPPPAPTPTTPNAVKVQCNLVGAGGTITAGQSVLCFASVQAPFPPGRTEILPGSYDPAVTLSATDGSVALATSTGVTFGLPWNTTAFYYTAPTTVPTPSGMAEPQEKIAINAQSVAVATAVGSTTYTIYGLPAVSSTTVPAPANLSESCTGATGLTSLGAVPAGNRSMRYVNVAVTNSQSWVDFNEVQVYDANGNLIPVPPSNIWVSSQWTGESTVFPLVPATGNLNGAFETTISIGAAGLVDGDLTTGWNAFGRPPYSFPGSLSLPNDFYLMTGVWGIDPGPWTSIESSTPYAPGSSECIGYTGNGTGIPVCDYGGMFTIDLGATYNVSRISLLNESFAVKYAPLGQISPDPAYGIYTISGSSDGSTFTPLGVLGGPTGESATTNNKWIDLTLPTGLFDIRSKSAAYPTSLASCSAPGNPTFAPTTFTLPPFSQLLAAMGEISSTSTPSGSAPVNGSCGPQNGETLNVAPTANLCSVGTASSVSGNGPWTWTCNGSNGGTNASCSANASSGGVDQVAGVCGSANGVAVSMAPAANLCSVGTATTVAGSGPWTWSCNGFDGGATASCNAGLLNGSTPLGQGVMVGLALSPFGSGWSSSITSAQPIPSGGISVSINPPTGFATQGKPYVLNTWCNATPSDYLGPPGADSTDLNTYQGPFVAVPSCTYAATGTYAMTVDLGVPTSTTSTFQWAEATYPITIGTPSSGGTPPPGSCSADDTACILQQLEAQVAALEAELQQLEAGQNGGTPPSASSTVSFPATINVTASSLNMRSSPQTGAPIVSVLNAGDTFTASGEVIGTNVEGDNLWWQTASTISASSSYVWSGGTVVTGQ